MDSSKNIFNIIENSIDEFSNKSRIFAEYILGNKHKIIFQTIRQMAQEARVSEGTIIRFLNIIGYSSYNEFINEVRSLVLSKIEAEALYKNIGTNNSNFNYLSILADKLAHDPVVQELAGQMSAARKILLLASPPAMADALRLKWHLSRLRQEVSLGEEALSQTEEELANLPEDSLVLILTTGPSTLKLMDLAGQTKKQQIPLFLITSNNSNSLSEYSPKQVILDNGPDGHNLVLPLAVSVLVGLVRPSLGPRNKAYQERLEKIALKHQPLSERSDTIQLAVGHDIRTFDPGKEHSLMREAMLMRCVFQGLVKFEDGSFEIVPELAESWNISDDGRSVVFYLRRGVQFHRGYGEFTAQDVRYSIERQTLEPRIKPWLPVWEGLEEVVELGRYAVRLTFRDPCPHLFSSILPMSIGSMVCKKAVEEMGQGQFSVNPIGTGPYAVTGFQPRETFVLEAHEQFWGTPPKANRLVFRLDTHLFNLAYHFRKGRLDAAVFPNVDPGLMGENNVLVMESHQALQFWWLGMVLNKPPFDQLLVRQAVRLAIDRDKILQTSMRSAKPLDTLIPEGLPGHWPQAQVYPYDPEEGRRLIRLAGLAPKTRVTLAANPMEIELALMEIIKANLADIGLDVQIDLYNKKLLYEYLDRSKFNMYITFYNAVKDPLINLRWFTKDQFYNFSKFNNDNYENILKLIPKEKNEDKKLQLIYKAQELINDEAWCIWLAQCKNMIIYKRNVDIGKPLPDGFLTPWTMSKKQ
jgi:peptide/nickel transport system substrate-binding protein